MSSLGSTVCYCESCKDKFKTPDIQDRKLFYDITEKTRNIISGYDFVNFFLWADSHNGKWQMYNDKLLIHYKDIDALMLPIGLDKISVSELINISDKMRNCGSSGNFIYADGDYVTNNRDELENYFDIVKDDNNCDYIHKVSDLVDLSGKRLKKKRNLIKQFMANNPDYIIDTLTHEHFKGCLNLATLWATDKDRSGKSLLGDDLTQLKMAIDHYDELELDGVVLLLDGVVQGFSIYSKQNDDYAICSFEKYNPEIKGAGQVINNEFAKVIYEKGFTYLNREQDLGIEGLRRAKRSYDPLFTKSVYNLTRTVS